MSHAVSFILFLCFLFGSCNSRIGSFVAKEVWGVKKAKVEDSTTLTTWLQQEGIAYDEVYATTPERFYTFAYQFTSRGLLFSRKSYVRPISLRGQQCLKREEEFLSATKLLQDDNSAPNPNLPVPVTLSQDEVDWAELEQFLYSLTGEKATLDTSANSDYYLFLPAAKWMGSTLQTSGLRRYIKAAHSNPHSSFRIIILNFDKQRWWGKEWCDRINILN